MCIPIARQRLCKHIPAEANARNNRTSIARQRISKHTSVTIDAVFSAWSVQRGYKERFSWEVSVVVRSWEFNWRRVHLSEFLSRNGLSSGGGSLRWLRRNGKKGIRLCKEDSMCDLKLQWDCYKSVARIWLVKTEKPIACVTVNRKECRSEIALYCL
jgi:hypothetical protein